MGEAVCPHPPYMTQHLGAHLVAPPCLARDAGVTAGHNFYLLGQDPNAGGAVIS